MEYKCLQNQIYSHNEFSIVPIRYEDRYEILKWRNEQIYHLRQKFPLTEEKQDHYFKNTVLPSFDQANPTIVLFSFLMKNELVGYGGLVHINWEDRNAEISFLMDTRLEEKYFSVFWSTFLLLIEKVAFSDLGFHKIFTYSFDLRQNLYPILIDLNFREEARLHQHVFFEQAPIDVVIYAKFKENTFLIKANSTDLCLTFSWASNPKIREYSINNKPIDFESHSNWFFEKLSDKNCYYYLLCADGRKVGSIRVDFDEKMKEGVISYLIDTNYQGKGLGRQIIKLLENKILIDSKKNECLLKALVLEENSKSVKILTDLNFNLVKTKQGVLYFEKIVKR